MSFTNIKVTWESAGETNSYGDVPYEGAVRVLARKQPKQELVRTADGRELLSKSIFYIDPKVEPHAARIKRLDKLDGEKVESVYVMCDAANRPKLYRFITI